MDLKKFLLRAGLAAGVGLAPTSLREPPRPVPHARALKPPTAQTAFPLTPEEEALLPALKYLLKNHEDNWLFAYRDPTDNPVVGVAFNTGTSETDHTGVTPGYLGRIPIDPSAAELWKLAGIPEKLSDIQEHAVKQNFVGLINREMRHRWAEGSREALTMEAAQKLVPKIPLSAQSVISADSADRLLDASTRQALYNGGGYFPHWDEYKPAQKLAFADMIYQMGPKIGGFEQMMKVSRQPRKLTDADWAQIIHHTENSDWYRKDSGFRAKEVVAMMSPHYRPPKDLRDLLPPVPELPHAEKHGRHMATTKDKTAPLSPRGRGPG